MNSYEIEKWINSGKKPTHEMLKFLFHYEKKTGFLSRRDIGGSALKDFFKKKQGPIIRLFTKDFTRSHVTYAFHTGKWPDRIVIHKNGNKNDNRIENLKLVKTNYIMISRKPFGKIKEKYISLTVTKRKGYEWVNYCFCVQQRSPKKNLIKKTFSRRKYSLKDVIKFRDKWLKKHSPDRYKLLNKGENK